MSDLWLVLGMGAAVYALRLGGLSLPAAAIRPGWEEALRFVPVALLAALVTIGLTGGGDAAWEWERTAAAGVAALVVWRAGTMWTCIVAGLLTFWVLRLV